MNKKLKIFISLLILFMFIAAFSASYKTLNVDNLAVVFAIGIDTSDTNKMKVSFQFTNASSLSESGTTEKAPSILYTVDASSINSAMNIMNTHLGKELTLSHCKVIVFSEEFAVRGITDEIYTLMNDVQVRPSANIVISKCLASYYIDNSKPIFEPLLTKYYEVFPNSSKYTGYTVNANIGDFFNALVAPSMQPYAILGGINNQSEQTDTTIDSQKDSSIKSSESSLKGEITSENTGVAVFTGGKLVGELNAIESLSLLNMRNKISAFFVSVPNPEKENAYIDLHLSPSKKTSINVDFINGSPYVKVDCGFTGKVYSMTENSKYLDSNLLKEISNSCDSYLESVFSNYLYKTSTNLKSDINGIGRKALVRFFTIKDFDSYNWNENYKNAFFSVTVKSNITSGNLLTET